MSLLLKRQIERLETAIELSTDWLEIQYLMAELDQIKQLYEELDAEAAWSVVFVIQPLVWSTQFSWRSVAHDSVSALLSG